MGYKSDMVTVSGEVNVHPLQLFPEKPFFSPFNFQNLLLVPIRAKDSVINYSLRIIRGIEDYVPLSLYLPGDEEYVLFCILVCMQCVPKHLSPGVLLLPTLGSIRL